MVSVRFSLVVLLSVVACGVLSTPVSFPDSQSHTGQRNEAAPAAVSESQDSDSLITPPSPTTPEEEAATEDETEAAVSEIVDRVPVILDRIQNYINSAIVSYSSNDTATNQPPAQLNQFLGLVNSFISGASEFAQQVLAPATEALAVSGGAEPAVAAGDNNEIVNTEKVE